MRRANKVKIAPNLVSAARSKVPTGNMNEATRSEESASQKTDNDETPLLIKKAGPGPSFSRYNSKNKIQPSNPSHTGRTFSTASESEDEVHEEATKSPAKKDNVDTTSTLKGKRLKKKCDEETPLSIKKANLKRKLASGDHSKLALRDYIHYNPPDGEKP
jgi:transcription factor TFIIIB component B''